MSVVAALEGFVHESVRWSIRGRAAGTQGKVGIAEIDFQIIEAMVEEQAPNALSQSQDGSFGTDHLIVYVAGKVVKNGREIKMNDAMTIRGIEYFVGSARYRIEGGYTKIEVRTTTRKALDA